MTRVLVLDDDEAFRELLCDLFAAYGCTQCVALGSVAELAARGDRALAADLAVLDVNLGAGAPGGLDAYRWLIARGFRGRIVFLTGHARSHPLVEEVYRLPRVQVLEKPIDAPELGALVAADAAGASP